MEALVTIHIEPFSLRHQKVIKVYFFYLELFETHLFYKHEFKAEEPIDKEDLDLGWEKVMICFERTALRDSVSSVDVEYIQATKSNKNEDSKWSVNIQMNGVGTDLIVYFKEEEAARSYAKKVLEWWRGK